MDRQSRERDKSNALVVEAWHAVNASRVLRAITERSRVRARVERERASAERFESRFLRKVDSNG